MFLVALLLAPAFALAQCPPDFTPKEYFKKCYLYVDTSTTFMGAESYCGSLNGHLVSIKDEKEAAFVSTLHLDDQHDKVWIGLNDFMGNGLSWTSNDPTTFTPVNMTAEKHCVTLRGYEWVPESCGANYTYVCQVLGSFSPSTTALPRNSTQPVTSRPDKAAFGIMISTSLLVFIVYLRSLVE